MSVESLLDRLSQFQAVKKDSLTFVGSLDCVSSNLARWAEDFVHAKQCYNNALNAGVIRGDDVVVGYVMFADIEVFIEHAWNYNDELGHYDLTAQLHWNGGLHDGYTFIELTRFTGLEGWDLVEEIGGIDHLSLRRDKRYRHLFR